MNIGEFLKSEYIFPFRLVNLPSLNIGELLLDIILQFMIVISVSDEVTSQYKSSNLGVIVVSVVDNVCLTSNVVSVSVKLRILLPLVAVCQVEPPSTEVSIVVVVKSDNQLAPSVSYTHLTLPTTPYV